MLKEDDKKLVTQNRVVLPADSTGIAGLSLFGYNRNLFAGTGIGTHCHPDRIELVYVVSGSIAFSQGDRVYTLHGGDVFVTMPWEEHSTGNTPTGVCEFYWMQLDIGAEGFLGLDRELARELIAGLLEVGCGALRASRRWEAPLQDVLRQLLSNTPPRAGVVAAVLAFLCDVMRRDAPVKDCSLSIAAATEYIRENIADELPLEQVAAAAALSLPGMKRKFSLEMGMPPREYINFMKIEKAKVLLLSGRTVTEAAFELGFASSNYFSVVFRKFTSQSPTKFKEQLSHL